MPSRSLSISTLTAPFVLLLAMPAWAQAQAQPPARANPGAGAAAPGATATPAPGTAAGSPAAGSTAAGSTAAPGAAAVGIDGGVKPVEVEQLAFEQELSSFMQPGALTSAEVAERAVRGSARIEAKQAAVTSAQKDADAVLGKFYPKLTGTARYTRLSEVAVPAGFESFIPPFDQWALQATLTIPVSDYVLRLSTALSGASKNEDAAKLTARAEELLVQTDARVAYYTWVKAKGAEYVATKAKEQVDTALKDVKQSFQMGVASKADVLRTEAQFFQSELRVLRAKQAVQVATENLRTVMHETEAKEYLVGESLLDELTVANIPTIEAGIDEARVKRLELQSLVKMEEATRDRATLAKVAYYPRLDLQGNALYAQPNTRVFPYNDGQWHGTWDASVVLSWTPTDIPQAMGEAGSATARASEIAAQRRAMEDGLRVEVAAAISEMNNTLASVQTTREALKSAEEGFRVRTELFKAGRATTLEVTDAQNALTAARLELVFAHADARIARDKLTHVLGRDVTAPSE